MSVFIRNQLFYLMGLLATLSLQAQVQPGSQPTTALGGNKFLGVPRYTNGDVTSGGTAASAPGFVLFNNNNTGTAALDKTYSAQYTGATWGVAYKTQNKMLYTSAVLRRHMSFGPNGIGAIYQINPNNLSANPSLFVDLVSLGVNCGTDPRFHDASPSTVDNQNEIPADINVPNWDQDAFGLIGKIGLGGLDISADGNRMYVMNLYEKKLVVLDISGATPTLVGQYLVPNPSCSGGSNRAWAVKAYNGRVLVGLVCDGGTSGNLSDVKSYVYEFVNGAFNTTPIFSISDMSYPRGWVGNDQSNPNSPLPPNPKKWNAWTDTYQSYWATGYIYPQPILSDIEVDVDGSLILGFADRAGFQGGVANYKPTYPVLDIEQSQSGGDILRVCNISGTYTLESTAGCEGDHPFANWNNQGPGTGHEFYWGDTDAFNQWNAGAGYHQETAQGGLAFDPGSDEIATNAMNPVNTFNSGGIAWFSHSSVAPAPTNKARGGRSRNPSSSADAGYLIFNDSGTSGPNIGKANGLGDVELYGDYQVGTVGNYVWADTDGNGLFNESASAGLDGVKVELWKSTDATVGNGDDVLINTAYTYTHNSNPGYYLFVVTVTGDYYVKFPTTNSGNPLTTQTATAATDGNSDANASGNSPLFTINIAGAGVAKDNMTIDAGYNTPTPMGSVGNFVWTDTDGDGIQDAGETGINGVTVELWNSTTNTLVATTTTANNGTNDGAYNFVVTSSANYYVHFTSPGSSYLLTTQTATAATDGNSDADASGNSPVFAIDVNGTGTAKDNPTIDAGYYPCSLSNVPLLTLSGTGFGPGTAPVAENVTINGSFPLNESNVAGFYMSPTSEGNFYTFCTEISQPILPLQNPYTHEATGSSNGFSASVQLRIAQVMQAAGFNSTTGFGAGNNTVTNFVAMQFAVWNAVYDTDYSVTSGNFQSFTDNNGARTLANTWLAAAQNITTPSLVVHKLRHPSGQDILKTGDVPPITLQATPPTCSGVGAPNNAALTLVGFTAGQLYQYSTGTSFNSGAAIPASATAIPVGGVIVNNLANTTQTYTVRVYDAINSTCYVDRTVTINAVSCVGLIGNYVWADTDADGVQDASETGINGVDVRLYKSNGTIIGKATTDASGFYYFDQTNVDTTGINAFSGAANSGSYTGLGTNSQYYILFSSNGQFSSGVFTIAGNTYNLSPTGGTSGSSAVNDRHDSDPVIGREVPNPLGYTLNNQVYIKALTGAALAKDSTFDMGLIPVTPEVTTHVSVSDCFDSNGNVAGGTSQVTVQVVVDWKNNPNNQDIIVTVPGASPSSQTIMFSSITSKTKTLYFDVPTSAPVSGNVTAHYSVSTSIAATPVAINIPVSNCVQTPCQSGNTGGNVFYDFNENGQKDAGETTGLSGVTVSAFWATESATGTATTTTDNAGQYEITTGTAANQIPNGARVRIEFSNLPTNLDAAAAGTDNGTNVQFITAPVCNANYGINYSPLYCQDNPLMVVPKMVCGDPLLAGTASTASTIAGFNYNDTYSTAVPTLLYANAAQTGSVWGTAYHQKTNKVFSSAIGRRHVGYGPLGTGGIYVTDLNTGTTSQFLNLATYNINTGANTHSGLSGNFNVPAADSMMFHDAGKIALGGLDLSEDGNYLYVMNLRSKELIKMEIGATATAPAAADSLSKLTKYSLASFVCNNGNLRPWAVKVHKGEVYVGLVCDAANGFKSDMLAKVLKLNSSTGTFSLVFETALDYTKGAVVGGGGGGDWNPWTESHRALEQASGNRLYYPQPILSSIAFDADNTMILGFLDRAGLQVGKGNYNLQGTGDYEGMAGGDILRVYNHRGVYQLETNAKEGLNSDKPATAGINDFQGPDYGEFFHDDRMAFSSASAAGSGMHVEVSLGSVDVRAGSGEVVNVVYDPNHLLENGGYSTGGIHWYSNITGTRTHSYMVSNVMDAAERLGKAGGLGDVELTCNAAPLEIGNYVWLDDDRDGVQDPRENAVSGLNVGLYNCLGTLVGITSTNAKGEYYFNTTNVANQGVNAGTGLPVSGVFSGLAQNSCYYIIFGANGQFNASNNQFATAEGVFAITSANTGEGVNADFNDSDVSLATGLTGGAATLNGLPYIAITTGTAGQINHTYDLGLMQQSLGNYVWLDVNKDGIQDASEVGVSGVTVTLIKTADNSILSTTTTDAFGYYLFRKIPADNYYVQFTLPIDYVFSPQGNSTNVLDSDVNPSGSNIGKTNAITLVAGIDNLDVDAGIYYAPRVTASLGNYVWLDSNIDGIQDATEKGVSDVVVELLSGTTVIGTTITNQEGYYKFTDLTPATYSVKFKLPVAYTFTTSGQGTTETGSDANETATGAAFGQSGTVTLAAGEDNLSLDAGIVLATNYTATVGNYVWNDLDHDGIQDATEMGLPNVQITLTNIKTGAVYATRTTDEHGHYLFTNVPVGEYKLTFSKSGYTITTKDATNDNADNDASPITGQTINFTLSHGDRQLQWDCGMYRTTPAGTASLGDYVWYDSNQNNTQDAAEIGVSGVAVVLYDATNTVKGKTYTDKYGKYLFTDLEAGTYYVQFSNIPEGYTWVTQTLLTANGSDADANGKTGTVVLAIGDNYLDLDGGLTLSPTGAGQASLGDKVWLDTNGDNAQQVNEPGIAKVAVTLYAEDGTTVLKTTKTDGRGNYIFTGLLPANYIVGFTTPVGYNAVTIYGINDPTIDSDADATTGKTAIITLSAGENNMTIDAGFQNTSGNTAKLGNYVWFDSNNDGTQDVTEKGVRGVTATLYTSANVFVATTTTDETGWYLFPNLAAGNYYVRFTNIPDGFTFTSKDQGGGNDVIDSDANEGGRTDVVSLSAGGTNLDVDAGLVSTRASIGNFVWYDKNEDGIQDVSEKPVSGVAVTLYNQTTNTALARAITDANGEYYFTNIPTGVTYFLEFTDLPKGAVFTSKDAAGSTDNNDSDVDINTGRISNIIPVAGSVNYSYDAGIVVKCKASLKGFAWIDTDMNGIQDMATERPAAGVTVSLLDMSTNVVVRAITDADGWYIFKDLNPANYTVQFGTYPLAAAITTQNATSTNPTDTNDSDADATTGIGETFTLACGDNARGSDIGFKPWAALGGYAFIDSIQDGVYDNGTETIVPNLLVTLYDQNDVALRTMETNTEGWYVFRNLSPLVQYKVGFAPIVNRNFTGTDYGSNDSTDSDVDLVSGKTSLLSGLPYNGMLAHIDAGFLKLGSVFPIELLSFTGALVENDGDLRWVTSQETNSSHFILERSIDNGKEFVPIANIPAVGNSLSPVLYQFTDFNIGHYNINKVMYRLQMVDIDGTGKESNTVEFNIQMDKEIYVNLFPNPSSNLVNLVCQFQGNNKANISIVNQLGQEMWSASVTQQIAPRQMSFDVSNWAKGVYYIHIWTPKGAVTEKLIVE